MPMIVDRRPTILAALASAGRPLSTRELGDAMMGCDPYNPLARLKEAGLVKCMWGRRHGKQTKFWVATVDGKLAAGIADPPLDDDYLEQLAQLRETACDQDTMPDLRKVPGDCLPCIRCESPVPVTEAWRENALRLRCPWTICEKCKVEAAKYG